MRVCIFCFFSMLQSSGNLPSNSAILMDDTGGLFLKFFYCNTETVLLISCCDTV
jgi:hypothetical protein